MGLGGGGGTNVGELVWWCSTTELIVNATVNDSYICILIFSNKIHEFGSLCQPYLYSKEPIG